MLFVCQSIAHQQKLRCKQSFASRSFVRSFLVLIAAMALLPALVAADENSDFRSAAAFFRAQRWQYATDEFQDFLKDYPNSERAPLARLYIGLCLNSLEDYKQSRTYLEQFVRDAPDNRNAADARYRIGECSYYLKDYDSAIQQLTKYLEKHDGHQLNSWGRLLLGESLNQKKQFVEAEQALIPILAVAKKDGILDDVEFALAASLQGQDKTTEAATEFQKLVDRKSDRFQHRALARLGMMAFDARNYAEAVRYYDRLVSDHPTKPGTSTAALQSGIANYQLGNFAEAIDRFKVIPSGEPAAEYGQLWTGLALTRIGKIDEARTVLNDAYQTVTDPTLSTELLFRRAELEMMDKQLPSAIAMFKDLTDRWPESRYVDQSLFNIADLQLEQGNVVEADDAVRRLLEASPTKADDPDVLTIRGRLMLKKDQMADAVELLTRAVDDPEASASQRRIRTYHLVRALHQAGKHQDVVSKVEPLADQLVADQQTDVAAMLSLAAISSLEIDDNEAALSFADQFIKVSPDITTQADALTARAIAASRTKDLDAARTDLQLLVDNFRDLPATWVAVLQSAESAWATKEYTASAEFFDLATNDNTVERIRVMALSGAGWSYFRLNEPAKAKERLMQLIQVAPSANETTEGRYLLARILVDEKQDNAAAEQFEIVFNTLKKTAADGEQSPDEIRYLFSSGRFYAQLLGRLNQPERANEVWKEMSKLFDRSRQLDQILDEWAVLNLQTANYDESDRIYRVLLDRFPNSPFAGQARLSLAESQMQGENLQPALEEFEAIIANAAYADRDKSAALYHIVDIYAARQQWNDVLTAATRFLQDYPNHDRAADIQLLSADAQVNLKQYEQATGQLMALRKAIRSGDLQTSDWSGRIWVLLAEIALAERRYSDVDLIANELTETLSDSKWLFQMRFLQGRRWKSQAPPDFSRARQYLQAVTSDEKVQGTETAARSQFLIAETYLLEESYENAAREYHRVHLIYNVPEWQARSLFQAAACEERLGRKEEAIRSYDELLADFPTHELVPKAKERLQSLKLSDGTDDAK